MGNVFDLCLKTKCRVESYNESFDRSSRGVIKARMAKFRWGPLQSVAREAMRIASDAS